MSTNVANIQLLCIHTETHETFLLPFGYKIPNRRKCSTKRKYMRKNEPNPRAVRLNSNLTLITTHLSSASLILKFSSEWILLLNFSFGSTPSFGTFYVAFYLCDIFGCRQFIHDVEPIHTNQKWLLQSLQSCSMSRFYAYILSKCSGNRINGSLLEKRMLQ